jgi:hypothetical protein
MLPRPPLLIGERVVWISDYGPELGTVCWIGILPDGKIKEYTVGVDFDNPVGTGTGKYNNKQLFKTRQNHASLIPVLGLMKAVEFYGSVSVVPSALSCGMQSVNSEMLVSTADHQNEPANQLTENVIYQGPGSENDQHFIREGQALSARFMKSIQIHSLNEPMPGIIARHGNSFPSSSYRPVGEGEVAILEQSIYDHESEHCYENMEKDESGRLLNRDTLAFSIADHVTELLVKCSGGISNNCDPVGVLKTGQWAAHHVDAVNTTTTVNHVVQRSCCSVDNLFTENDCHLREKIQTTADVTGVQT